MANIPFEMHLAHIVFVNSLAMISIFFKLHLTLHVPIGTLAMVYIFQNVLGLNYDLYSCQNVPCPSCSFQNLGYGLHFLQNAPSPDYG